MTTTETTTVLDGWSRDADGKLRMTELQAFRAYSFLTNDPVKAPAYAVNLECPTGIMYQEFLERNGILIDPFALHTRH
jgi:hypothetical protein